MSETEKNDKTVLELKDGHALLRIGEADEKTAVLTESRIASLRAAVDTLEKTEGLHGVVILGPSAQGFCAGADIGAIKSVRDPAVGTELAKQGQSLFNRIADLPCRTVAAISGACVGGGCELVLACDYRILLNNPETKIGLPEVKLGILPGFGGSQRLPRLVGLPKALDIILKGRVVSAKHAKRIGLADALVPVKESLADSYANLEQFAVDVAVGKVTPQRVGISLIDRFLTCTAIGRNIVKSKAEKAVRKETQGHYPAPPRALEVSVSGLGKSLEEGLAEEARAPGRIDRNTRE